MSGQAGRPNEFDDHLDAVVQAMVEMDTHLARMADGVRPFDSRQVSPEEDQFIYHNPSQYYPGEMNKQTGQPYTNAEAAQRMLAEMGAQRYIKWVESNARRADQPAPQEGATGGPGPDDTNNDNPSPDV